MKNNALAGDKRSDAERSRPRRLGEILRERGLITAEQLDVALKHQADIAPTKQLGQILVDLHLVRSDLVVQALADSVGVPFAVVTPEMVHADALTCLPSEFLDKHNLLPLSMVEGWLTIAIEQFTNVFLIEEIGRRAGCRIQSVAAEPGNIRQVRGAMLPATASASSRGDAGDGFRELLAQISVDDLKVVEQEQEQDDASLAADATESPVIKLVNYVITNAVNMRASDIHIEPDDGTFRVRCRVDGELLETIRPSSRLLPAVVSRIKIMAGMDISERRLPQDGGFTATISDRPVDLRVSSMATKYGEKVVMRIADRDSMIRSLESLGFEPVMLGDFRAVIKEPNGMVLVTGPTGSGKTTTLYGALAEIVSQRHNISTIEDPVERKLPGTNQFQVHVQAGFTFAGALRSLLRQDPDVIMVGEIRDPETAKLATEAALTGHMVLTTLHTNDAPTAVPRLVNMGVEPYLVAASLRAVLAQRLVRRVCPHCGSAGPLRAAERTALTQLCGSECPLEVAHAGPGCSRCGNAGSIGRIGVYELMLLNEELLSSITRDPNPRRFREMAKRHGMTNLLEDGLAKVRQGLISVEGLLEIASRTDDPVNEVPHLTAAGA